MSVDSFKFLPRLIATFYQMQEGEAELPIPWTPLRKPLQACRFALVTSAGMYDKRSQEPFNLERERREPTWGDPSFRVISADIPQSKVGISHLHYNPIAAMEDINILLPLDRMKEMVAGGRIGSLAHSAYSFMGYQGYPPSTKSWKEVYAPQVIKNMRAEGVDCVMLIPV
jgi:D-proline reductase (dithiol) PrdB